MLAQLDWLTSCRQFFGRKNNNSNNNNKHNIICRKMRYTTSAQAHMLCVCVCQCLILFIREKHKWKYAQSWMHLPIWRDGERHAYKVQHCGLYHLPHAASARNVENSNRKKMIACMQCMCTSTQTHASPPSPQHTCKASTPEIHMKDEHIEQNWTLTSTQFKCTRYKRVRIFLKKQQKN